MRILAILFLSLLTVQFATSGYAADVKLTKICKMPPGSYKHAKGVHAFTLADGMLGGCKSSDRTTRVRANGEVEPFKERAEVVTGVLKADRRYVYSQELRFDANARSGPRTTFFQIHQVGPNKNCKPNPGPALMMQLENDRVQFNLKVNAGHKNSHKNYRQIKTKTRRAAMTEWTRLEVHFDTTKDRQTDVVVFLNERAVLKERLWFTGCGTPYIRTGLYRPGTTRGDNPTDRYWVRNTRLVEVK